MNNFNKPKSINTYGHTYQIYYALSSFSGFTHEVVPKLKNSPSKIGYSVGAMSEEPSFVPKKHRSSP